MKNRLMPLKPQLRIAALGLAVFFLAGCSGGDYGAEKKYAIANYKLKQLLSEKNKNSAEIDDLVHRYKEIIVRYPFWPMTVKAYENLAQLYLLKGEPDTAIKQEEMLCENYKNSDEICASALEKIAGIYEVHKQDKKTAAEKYEEILKEYPETDTAMHLKLRLAAQMKKNGRAEDADSLLNEVIAFYRKKAFDSDRPDVILKSLDAVVTAMEIRGSLRDVLPVITELKAKHSNSTIELSILLGMAKLYEIKLKDSQKALTVYREIDAKYPGSPYAKTVKERIRALSGEGGS